MNKSITKVIFFICFILIVIFVSEYASQKYLEVTSARIEKKVFEIESAIKKEQWNEVDIKLKDMQQDWESVEKVWAILIDHFEIDNIDNSLARMCKFIETTSSKEALAEAGSLQKFLNHIPRKTALSLENFLILKVSIPIN